VIGLYSSAPQAEGQAFSDIYVDCVVLSHIHLDHSADINSVIESATDGGKKREVVLFAPRSALEGENRVVLPFIRRERLAGEFILEEGKEYNYNGSPARHSLGGGKGNGSENPLRL
jgi:ribonuclease BN (tRNA processing enzyme)